MKRIALFIIPFFCCTVLFAQEAEKKTISDLPQLVKPSNPVPAAEKKVFTSELSRINQKDVVMVQETHPASVTLFAGDKPKSMAGNKQKDRKTGKR